MLKKNLMLLSLALMCWSCQNNDVTIEYQTVMVKFFTGHDTYAVQDPIFETFYEQILIRAAYKEGATFETITEQVLDKEGYTQIDITSQSEIEIITNTETGASELIPCIQDLTPDNFVFKEVPSTYITRIYEIVAVNGTGKVVPAEYGIRTFQRLVKDSQVVDLTPSLRPYTSVSFVIPSNIKFTDYLKEHLTSLGVTNCLSNRDFRIVD